MYYLRTRAAADAIKFTVDQQAVAKNRAARQSSGGGGTPAPLAPKALLPVIEAPIGFTPTPELKVRAFGVKRRRCKIKTDKLQKAFISSTIHKS